MFHSLRPLGRQASLSFTVSQSLLKLLSAESVMPSNFLIYCHPLHLLPSIFPSIRVFPMRQLFVPCGQSIGASASVQFNSAAQASLTLCDPWTAAHQASLSIANSRSLLKLMSIESVMPSNHLILCQPLLLPPSIFPRIMVFSNESVDFL